MKKSSNTDISIIMGKEGLFMVLSMTGYGRAEQERSGRDITVEIKSVNSRYFEYTSRMPRSFAFLDDKLKSW